MRTNMLLLSVVAISIVGTSLVGAAGLGIGINGLFGSSHEHVTYNGIYMANAPYNGIRHNATARAEAAAAVAQCKTAFADNASAVTSNDFGISVSTSRLNQANANLQSNVTANATSFDTRISLALFQNAFSEFSLMYRLATHGLNSTQTASLKTSLSGSANALSTCVSGNSVVGAEGEGYGMGFGMKLGSGFGGSGGHLGHDRR